jgi:hypothetical protein
VYADFWNPTGVAFVSSIHADPRDRDPGQNVYFTDALGPLQVVSPYVIVLKLMVVEGIMGDIKNKAMVSGMPIINGR